MNKELEGAKTKRKCDSCGQWIAGRPKFCPLCFDYVDLNEKREDLKEMEKQRVKEEKRAAFNSKPAHIRFFLTIGHAAEVVYVSIMSFIGWLLLWIAG